MSGYVNNMLETDWPKGSLGEQVAHSLGEARRVANNRPSLAERIFRQLVEQENKSIEEAAEIMVACPHPGPLWDDDDDSLDGSLYAYCRDCGFTFVWGRRSISSIDECQEYAQSLWREDVEAIVAAYRENHTASS